MLLQKYDDEGLGNGSEIWTEKMGDRLNGQGLGGGSFFLQELMYSRLFGGSVFFFTGTYVQETFHLNRYSDLEQTKTSKYPKYTNSSDSTFSLDIKQCAYIW